MNKNNQLHSELAVVKTEYGWSASHRPVSWFLENCFSSSTVNFERQDIASIDCVGFVRGLKKNAPLFNIVMKLNGVEPKVIQGGLFLSVLESALESDVFLYSLSNAERRGIYETLLPIILI